jgi:hypothetical protein
MANIVPQLILVPKPSEVEECVWNSVAAPFLVRIHEASLALKVQPRLAFEVRHKRTLISFDFSFWLEFAPDFSGCQGLVFRYLFGAESRLGAGALAGETAGSVEYRGRRNAYSRQTLRTCH